MSRRTKLFPAAAAATAMLMLAGCTGAGDDNNGGNVELTVAVWSNWGFVERAAEAYTAKNPNVTINVEAISGDDYFSAMPRTIGTSDAPDITVLQVAETGPYQDLIEMGALVDVSDIWADQGLEAATDPTITDAYTQPDGNRYAVNVGPTFLPVTFYNKDLFAAHGIEVTDGGQLQSIGELYDISDTLQAAGVTPMTYPFQGDAHHLFQQQLLSACGEETYLSLGTAWKDDEGSAAKWDDECVVRSIESQKAWGDSGVLGENAVIDRDVAAAAFASGNAAMMTTGMWGVAQFREQVDFDFGWFMTPPAIDGDLTKWILWTADGLGVNASSPNADVAADFLSTIMTQEFQSSMLSDGRPPSRQDITVPDDADQMLVDMQASFATYGTGVHIVQGVTPADYQAVISDGMQEVMLGSLSAEDLASRLQQLTDELRADNQ